MTSSIDDFLIPPSYESRFVDVSSMQQDSLVRIAEMSRARRQRMMAEEEVWAEQVKFREEANSLLSEHINSIVEEESLGRGLLSRTEEKAFDRLKKMIADETNRFRGESEKLQKIRKLERRRDRKVRQLEQELYKSSFRAFSAQNNSSPAPEAKLHPNPEIDTINQTTGVLRHAYEFSTPPFATDPEEFWRRGVTVAPDLQKSVTLEQGSIKEALKLPAYHEFSMELRKRYEAHVQHTMLQSTQTDKMMGSSPARRMESSQFSPYSQFAESYPYGSPPM